MFYNSLIPSSCYMPRRVMGIVWQVLSWQPCCFASTTKM